VGCSGCFVVCLPTEADGSSRAVARIGGEPGRGLGWRQAPSTRACSFRSSRARSCSFRSSRARSCSFRSSRARSWPWAQATWSRVPVMSPPWPLPSPTGRLLAPESTREMLAPYVQCGRRPGKASECRSSTTAWCAWSGTAEPSPVRRGRLHLPGNRAERRHPREHQRGPAEGPAPQGPRAGAVSSEIHRTLIRSQAFCRAWRSFARYYIR